jgi:hypothetical protein
MSETDLTAPPLASLLTRWAAPARLYLQTSGGVEEPRGRRGRRFWIISRGLCRFFKVPLLADASAAHQIDALKLQIERLSPFVESGSHAHFGPDFVSLWLWDADTARLAAETIGVDLTRMRVLPETALRPNDENGVRLVTTLDGIEGQSWIKGSPAASHWWPTPPDAGEWLRFVRGASVAHDHLAPLSPTPLRLDWLERPWTRTRVAGSFALDQLDLRIAAVGIGAVMLVFYCYFGAEWLRLVHDVDAATAAAAARSQASTAITEARATALDNLAMIENLRALDRYPSQLEVMARVAGSLPKNETHLTAWSYDHGQLEVTVAADHPLDARFFVRSLEQIDGFKNVSVQRAGDDNSLNIRLMIDPK